MPTGAPEPQPETEEQRALREREAEIERLRQQNASHEQVINRVREFAEQQAIQTQRQQVANDFNTRRERIYATAREMDPQSGMEFISREMATLNNDALRLAEQVEQQAQQRSQAEREAIATPLYARHLVQAAGLPEEYEQRLLAFGNPNAMYAQMPHIVADYQRTKALQDQIDQIGRTAQANGLVRQGAGMVGGAIAPQTIPVEYDDSDPDAKARAIYNAMKARQYQPT